jgi:hypothetical protein
MIYIVLLQVGGRPAKVKCAHYKARIRRSRQRTGMATRNKTPQKTEVQASSFRSISFGINQHICRLHRHRRVHKSHTLDRSSGSLTDVPHPIQGLTPMSEHQKIEVFQKSLQISEIIENIPSSPERKIGS